MSVSRVEADGTCRIWHTLTQAAHMIGRSETTLRRWISNGDLTAHTHDLVPGVTLIEEDDLLHAEAAVRARAGASTRYRRAA